MSRIRVPVVLGAAVVVALVAWLAVDLASDSPSAPRPDPETGLPWIAAADLPPEGRETLELIASGGPFPYDRDGVVFQNREGLLPDEASGYYREYTVPTPGSDDRGARRIVAGADGELYYTDDHYDSFRRVGP